jgi:ubiquinone/menaquinone biosynthesis C-methylase UbiE
MAKLSPAIKECPDMKRRVSDAPRAEAKVHEGANLDGPFGVNLMAQQDEAIKSRWEEIPVGENIIGSLSGDFGGDYDAFFRAFDVWRYKTEGHIVHALDRFQWQGKRVLEIGLGQGTESEQLIRRGAVWSGIDLTEESVTRVRMRLDMRGLSYEQLVQGSSTQLPFPDRQFDIVFSHGVLHHIPNVDAAQREIRRVLKDDGRLVMMVYARHSLNYHLAIKIIRRLGLTLMYVLPTPLRGVYGEHKKLAREAGLLEYMKMRNFIHRSTDGPTNPYSKVYDRKTIEKDFAAFELINSFKLFMHAPPLPVHGLPGGRIFGWHLWAELKPRLER